MVLSSLGILARRRGDLARAQELSRASLALAERSRNAGAVADALDDLAQVVERQGDYRQAQALYERALAMARELGQAHLQCFVLLHLARMQSAAGNDIESARALREALTLAAAHDFQTGRLMAILGAAGLRVRRSDAEAETVACRWCRTVLDAAGSNVEVRDAVPSTVRALLHDRAQADVESFAQQLDAVSVEVLRFLDA